MGGGIRPQRTVAPRALSGPRRAVHLSRHKWTTIMRGDVEVVARVGHRRVWALGALFPRGGPVQDPVLTHVCFASGGSSSGGLPGGYGWRDLDLLSHIRQDACERHGGVGQATHPLLVEPVHLDAVPREIARLREGLAAGGAGVGAVAGMGAHV